MTELDRVERLKVDVDTRLFELWNAACEVPRGEWTLDLVLVFMRAAYAKGAKDALEDGGELYRDHGYELPERRS